MAVLHKGCSYKFQDFYDFTKIFNQFKINNNDLGYKKIDRDKNAKRLINLVEYLSNQNINLIVSANITSIKFRKIIKKKLRNFYEIHISAELKSLLKRDHKSLYKKALSKKIKNVVGVDIKYYRPKNCFLYLTFSYYNYYNIIIFFLSNYSCDLKLQNEKLYTKIAR